MEREFNYGYNNSIMAIHAKVELEIVDMFKESGVNKIHLNDGEDDADAFYMVFYDEWSDGATNQHITDIEIEVEYDADGDVHCVEMKLYTDNKPNYYFGIDDSADGNAILRVYERVYQHFYSVKK